MSPYPTQDLALLSNSSQKLDNYTVLNYEIGQWGGLNERPFLSGVSKPTTRYDLKCPPLDESKYY